MLARRAEEARESACANLPRGLCACALATATFALVGCGGQTLPSSTRPGATPSNTEAREQPAAHFRARAEAICTRLAAKLRSIHAPNIQPETVARVATQRIKAERSSLEELTSLHPSAGDEAAWQQFLRYRRELIAGLHALVTDGLRHDTQAMDSEIAASTNTEKLMGGEAQRQGLGACAQLE